MKFILSNIAMTAALAAGIGYFIWVIISQYRAQIRLEKILRTHQKEIQKKFIEQKNKMHSEGAEVNYEILIMLLREQIHSLNNEMDQQIMQKTLDRKNFNNQKNYALKLFSESGYALF